MEWDYNAWPPPPTHTILDFLKWRFVVVLSLKNPASCWAGCAIAMHEKHLLIHLSSVDVGITAHLDFASIWILNSHFKKTSKRSLYDAGLKGQVINVEACPSHVCSAIKGSRNHQVPESSHTCQSQVQNPLMHGVGLSLRWKWIGLSKSFQMTFREGVKLPGISYSAQEKMNCQLKNSNILPLCLKMISVMNSA